jgi:hypothetical protein
MANANEKTRRNPEPMGDPKRPPRNPKEEMRQRLGRRRARKTPEEQGVTRHGDAPLFHDMLIIGPEPGGKALFRVPVVKRAPNAGGAHGGHQSQAAQVGGNTAVASAASAPPSETPESQPASGEQLVRDPLASPETPGNYVDTPEKLDAYDYAERRTMSIARPQDWGAAIDRSRGPAFGTLPVKREPAATHCFACYLVDAQNFSFRNAWTAEEWNDIADEDLDPHPSADDDTMEVLLAGPRGKVFYLKLLLEEAGNDLWPSDARDALRGGGFLECLDLRYEVEIWNQLRNGVVAGRVLSHRKATIDDRRPNEVDYVPLVNVTSLVPDEPMDAAQRGARVAKGAAE